MSGPPVVWMHRTRRFWLGLFGLVALTGLWVASCHVSCKASWDRPVSKVTRGGSGGSGLVRLHWCAVSHGALAMGYAEGITDVRPTALPELHMDPGDGGYTLWPEAALSRGRHHCGLKVPLWLLPAGWAVLWPLLMHRGDVKERRRFGVGHQEGQRPR